MLLNLIQNVHLLEGISHLEDLEINKFIDTIGNFSKFIATEKLDGFNMRFGLDNDGKFYTSRESKGNKDLFYNANDYKNNAAQSKFRATHLGLEKKIGDIKKILSAGEAIEVEVLFGRQPNAITYGIDGKNFIALLRTVPGTDETKTPDQSLVKKLADKLNDAEVSIRVKLMDTDDGLKLKEVPVDITWKFVKAHDIDTSNLKGINFKAEIKKLKSFLEKKNEVAKKNGLDLSNFEIMTINLTSVKKDIRGDIKAEKIAVNETVLNDFKLPIKEKILDNFLRKIKPKLQATDVSDEEDVGVEGVVLLDPETQDQIKIVDKNLFTSINQFNYAIRNTISGSIKSTDPLADIANKGGLFGDAKIRISSLFGLPNLARTIDAKRTFRKFKGKNPTQTLKNFADNLDKSDFQDVKTKVLAILKNVLSELDTELNTFKKEYKNYKLTLKSGKTLGYSQEIIKRTLVAFAELRSDVNTLSTAVKKSKTIYELIGALYGEIIEAIHNEEVVKECLMVLEAPSDRRQQLLKMKAGDITGAYTATLLASLLLLKNNNKKAKALLHDVNNAALKKYRKDMSPLNFWGLVLFHPEHKDIARYLRLDVKKEMKEIASSFLSLRIKSIHSSISLANTLNLNWNMQHHNMRVVTLRLNNRTSNINIIRNGIDKWNDLPLEDRNLVIQKMFGLLLQYAPSSPLVNLIGDLSNKVLTHATRNTMDTKSSLIKDVMKIITVKEEDEGGADAATTSSGDIATQPVKIFKGKILKRVSRTYKKIPKIRVFSLNKK